MSTPYVALAAVSILGALALLGLVALVVRLPLRLAAQRDAACAAERRRLAREMHDGLTQELASLGYLVDALAVGATPEDRDRLHLLRQRITAMVAEARRSLVGLRLGVDEGGLRPALETLAAGLTELGGVPIEVTIVDTPAGRLARRSPAVDGELFRIAQEALNNAIKHAAASRIRVEGELCGTSARLTITDDGHGFRGRRHGSHGLSVMHERARLIGATLTLGNVPGGGFRVTVTLPAERLGRRGEPPLVVPNPRAPSPILEVF